MKFCFVFVCQQGELEIKALLLAASLRQHLRCRHELVAAVPQPHEIWGSLADNTASLLRQMDVRVAPIENPIGPDYPIGNKLACLGIETGADKLVFLDSDMVCLRDFGEEARFALFDVNVKPADLATSRAAALERWEAAYASAGLGLPSVRIQATVSGDWMPPYFNAGFIGVRSNCGLAAEWIACARALDKNPDVPDKRPWLDQIALPIALAKLGLGVDCLDESYNFPAHLKPLDPADLPRLCHYHWPEVIRREPAANAAVLQHTANYPALREALEGHPAWSRLLKRYTLARPPKDAPATVIDTTLPAAPPPELIVTGIPRSGTSLLCKLIHSVHDCVVINEPPEIFAPLVAQRVPWGLALHYRELRRDVLDARAIANKLRNGEFIEDTAVMDTVESYLPEVHRPDFLLGTKNTLAYLARLRALRKALPTAGIIACIRHPLDTIASWKVTFPHLATADLEGQPLGHSRDALMTDAQRARLVEIAGTRHLARRRALMWTHLAKLLIENREILTLLRYEDVVRDPSAALRAVFASIPNMFPVPSQTSAESSTPRSKRRKLDEDDLAEIRVLCRDTAAELGYVVD